ncbi:MAG: magnesium transporter [Chitinivibrionales bacterium]|nr:magnesium transporter [Chitinivibrionales bacterium]
MERIKQEIETLIEQRNWNDIRQRIISWEVPEITDLLADVDKKDKVLIFRCLPRAVSAEVFSYMEPEDQDSLLRELTDSETRQILTNLDPDDRTAILEELPATITLKLMNLLSYEDLKEARFLLGYPEESVGRLMTPDYAEIKTEWTVERALQHIRAVGKDNANINRLYITDNEGKLLDDIRLRRLILADPDDKIRDIMDHSFISLSAFDDREKAVLTLQRYDIVAAPVVDSEGVLIGIVTVDDIMDVAEEEVTEDIQKSAAVAPLNMSYHRAGPFDLYTKRVGWLVALVFMNLISAGVIAAFEDSLAGAITLVFFIPILLASGGNSGSQSATLIIRALVTNDVESSEWLGSLFKELMVGLLLGATLGIIVWFIGLLRGGIGLQGVKIGIVVSITMICIVILANVVGVLLPFLLNKLKLDPAVASSPLITTIADATGLLIYFSVAEWILQI